MDMEALCDYYITCQGLIGHTSGLIDWIMDGFLEQKTSSGLFKCHIADVFYIPGFTLLDQALRRIFVDRGSLRPMAFAKIGE